MCSESSQSPNSLAVPAGPTTRPVVDIQSLYLFTYGVCLRPCVHVSIKGQLEGVCSPSLCGSRSPSLGSSGLGASTLPAEPCGQLYKDILFFLRKKILAPPNQVHQGGFWPRTDIYQGWGSRGPSLETEHWLWPSWNTKEPSVGARPGCPGVNACLTAFLNGACHGSWVAGIQQQVHSIGSGVEGGLR